MFYEERNRSELSKRNSRFICSWKVPSYFQQLIFFFEYFYRDFWSFVLDTIARTLLQIHVQAHIHMLVHVRASSFAKPTIEIPESKISPKRMRVMMWQPWPILLSKGTRATWLPSEPGVWVQASKQAQDAFPTSRKWRRQATSEII